MRILATAFGEELEATRGAMEILTIKLNEVAGHCSLETIEDIVGRQNAKTEEIDKQTKEKPMPANDGLSGMDTE